MDRNQAKDQIIRAPFQNVVLEEEQEFAYEEGEAEDNINCMEDEVDLSFLTQSAYEETLMNEQITEESLYQADDQEGYNLRSRIVAPIKKSHAPAKQPTSHVRNIASFTKIIATPPKQQQNPFQPSFHDQIQLKDPPQEVRAYDRLSYSFNLESEI